MPTSWAISLHPVKEAAGDPQGTQCSWSWGLWEGHQCMCKFEFSDYLVHLRIYKYIKVCQKINKHWINQASQNLQLDLSWYQVSESALTLLRKNKAKCPKTPRKAKSPFFFQPCATPVFSDTSHFSWFTKNSQLFLPLHNYLLLANFFLSSGNSSIPRL